MNQPDLTRSFYLPRLPRVFYQSDAVIFWTMPVSQRAKGWLTERFQFTFRELVLHTAARERLFCPVYCLMPDHLHLMLMGLHPDSDQLNGIAFLRTYLEPALAPAKFQHQAHEHVLADKERKRGAFAATCSYILNNPVRARLVSRPQEWPYYGAIVPGYPKFDPLQSDFWPKFWRLYMQNRHPDCGKRKLPPRSGNTNTSP